MFDLSGLSFEQLNELETRIAALRQSKQEQALIDLVAELMPRLQVLGVTPSELARRLDGKKQKLRPNGKEPLPPMYRDKQNPELDWSGRGRKPLWVLAWLEQGGSLDDLLI